MIITSAADLRDRSGRLGLWARLEDEGPPIDGLLLIDGSAEEWSQLSALPGETDPPFIASLSRFPAVTVGRFRGLCSGFAQALARAIDLPSLVGVSQAEPAQWAFEGNEDDFDAWLIDLSGSLRKAPVAASAAAVLLRSSGETTVAAGLSAESSTYAMLQAGEEFQRWLRACNG